MELSTGGIIFMIGSWTVIVGLCAFCFGKVFGGKKKD